MARKNPFESLQTLAKGRETRWQRSAGQQLRALQTEQQRLEQLHNFAEEYSTAPAAPDTSQSILAVRGQRQFVDRLRDAVGQQQQTVATRHAAAEREVAEWRQARAKRMALDKFVERRREAETRKRDRSQQRALDEVGNRTFIGRRDK